MKPDHSPLSHHNGLPWRSHEIMRIEGISDAVFAFAVTLLVISLEVPRTFAELWEAMHGFLAFAISFAMLFQLWYAQHLFFRRYALQDKITVVLNAILLFCVLFYVYPLKFLFSYLINSFSGGHGMVRLPNGHMEPMITEAWQVKAMMLVYGVGFTAVFLIFALLYWRAYSLRRMLAFTDLEKHDTQESLIGNLLMASIGLLSVAIALVADNPGRAGATYILIAPVQTIYHTMSGRKRRKMERALAATSSGTH